MLADKYAATCDKSLSSLFFFLLIISGFASGLGLVEGVVGTLDEAWKLGRNKTLFLVLATVLLLSLPPLLSLPFAG